MAGSRATTSIQARALASEPASAMVMCKVMADAQAAATCEIGDDGGLVAAPGPRLSSRAIVEGRLSAARKDHTWATPGPRICHAPTSAGSLTQGMRRSTPAVALPRSWGARPRGGSCRGWRQSMAAQRSASDNAFDMTSARMASLPDQLRAVAFPFPLSPHPIGAGGERDGCVLLVPQLGHRNAHADVSDV